MNTQSPPHPPAEPTPGVARRAVIAASFGNAMEWYDFSVYAFFATYIAANFFAKGDSTQGMLSTFMVFAAGFIARPIGAVVIGLVGDRRGRKTGLLMSLFAMGLGVLLIAVTPPVSVIGIGAPILLLLGRLLQGFSAGGELGSAAAFMIEQAPTDRQATYASWLQASMGVSNLMSALLGLTLTSVFDEDTVTSWAWRIPFVLGLALIPVGLYIRKDLPETQTFEEETTTASTRSILTRLITRERAAFFSGLGFSALWTVAVYAFVIYGPTYYQKAPGLHFHASDGYLASAVGNVLLIAGCVTAGRLADRIGRRRVATWSALALCVVPVVGLLVLHAAPHLPVLLVVHSLICVTVAAFVGVAPSTLPMAFPAPVRATGISVCYNIAAIFLAGFTPVMLTWAVPHVSVYAPALLVAICALITLAALPTLFRQISVVAAAEGSSHTAEAR